MAHYINFTKATFNPYNPRVLNEGQFSWMTHDTGKQIGSERQNTIDVWMYDNEGNSWYEDRYEGYGEFGGMDYYELLAKMNGYSEEDLEKGQEMRKIGIDLAFGKLKTKDKKRKVLFPALSSSPKYNWKRHDFTQEAESDPNQSWYQEDDYDEYDDYYDESVSEKVEPGEYSGLYYDVAVKVFKKERIKGISTALIDGMLKRAHEDGHLEYTAEYVRDAEKDIRAAIDKIGEDNLRMYAFGASESAVTENSELVDRAQELDDIFQNSRNRRAIRDWEEYTEDLFAEYSGDQDGGRVDVYWEDIPEDELQTAIDVGQDMMNKYKIKESAVTENYEVIYSDGVSAMKKFSNERKARAFFYDKIRQKGMKNAAIYKADSGFHSTSQTEYVVAFWGDGSYLDNVSKKDAELAKKKVSENASLSWDSLKESLGLNEARYDKKKLLKAIENLDDAIILVKGKEYIIYNPNNNNADNAAMWGDKTIFALDQDGDEYEIKYSDIERFSESVADEKLTYKGREIKDEYDYEVGDIVGNTVDGFDFEVIKLSGTKVEVKHTKTGKKVKGNKRNYYIASSDVNEGRSINKISKDHASTVVQMADTAKEWKEADGDRKSELLDKLRVLNKKKSDLEKELDAAVAGKDRGLELSLQEAEELAYLEIEVNKILEEAQNNEEN